MKSPIFPILGIILFWAASAAVAQDEWPAVAQEAPAAEFFSLLGDEELDELVGPLALHADALVALILPASTFPAEIVLARRYLETKGDPRAIDNQPWDESVRSLAHNPDLLGWLDENLEWTVRLGEAFAAQPADVMNAIQRMRGRAHAAGALQSTPQQQVIVETEYIAIVPAQPDIIYMPYYDPAIVYLSSGSRWRTSYLSYGIGFSVGSWLSYDCDWRSRRIWYVDRVRFPHYRHDWRYPRFPGQRGYVHHPGRRPWTPPHVSWRHDDLGRPTRSVASPVSDSRRGEPSGNQRSTFNHSTRGTTPDAIVRPPVSTLSQTTEPGRGERDFSGTTKRNSEIRTRSSPIRTIAPSYSGASARTEWKATAAPPFVVRQPRVVAQPNTSASTRSVARNSASSSKGSVSRQVTSPQRTVAAPSTSSSGRDGASSSKSRGGPTRKAHEN